MKTIKKLSIVLSFFFMVISLNSNAQHLFNTNYFWQGEIKTTNGQIIKGYIRVPDEPDNKNVAYRLSKDDKKLEINSEEIETITVVSEKGIGYTFERFATRYNCMKEKISKSKVFLLVFKKGSHATFYITSTGYVTNDKTGTIDIVSSFVQTKDLPMFSYLIRKKDQTFADVFGQTSPSPTMFGLNRALKIRSEYLIGDDKELVARIQNGEFKHKDIPVIIEKYLNDMEGK